MTAPQKWPPAAWGEKPATVPLYLTRGADAFIEVYPPPGDTFAAGATAKMVIFASESDSAPILATWGAAVSPTVAEIIVQSEVTDAIPGTAYARFYYSGTDTPRDDYCLTAGPVIRY